MLPVRFFTPTSAVPSQLDASPASIPIPQSIRRGRKWERRTSARASDTWELSISVIWLVRRIGSGSISVTFYMKRALQNRINAQWINRMGQIAHSRVWESRALFALRIWRKRRDKLFCDYPSSSSLIPRSQAANCVWSATARVPIREWRSRATSGWIWVSLLYTMQQSNRDGMIITNEAGHWSQSHHLWSNCSLRSHRSMRWTHSDDVRSQF